MSVIGYKRVSSEGQNLDRQDLGEVDKVFEEKLSGKSAKDRPALQAMIEYAREGDAVVVIPSTGWQETYETYRTSSVP